MDGSMPGMPPDSERRRAVGRRASSMPRGARERERTFAVRLDLFKRFYRWLNLTLVQQGLWPLLVVLAAAPVGSVASTPLPWWLARAGAPALAAALAWVYLRQRPGSDGGAAAVPPIGATKADDVPAGGSGRRVLFAGAAWLLPGLALMLAAARIVVGPAEPAVRLILFGVADVAAFQLIHFGVVRRSWRDDQAGTLAAIGLFGASWGLRAVFQGAATGRLLDPWLAFAGAAAAGLAVALLSWAVRRWMGGFWSAAAAHLVVVYLILGFA